MERLLRTCRVSTEEHLRESDLHLDGDEVLLSAVMQVSFESSALLVLRCDETLARCAQVVEPCLQIGGQADIPEHQPGLTGQVHEEFLLDGCERLATVFGHAERTEKSPLMAHLDDPARARDGGQRSVGRRYRLG